MSLDEEDIKKIVKETVREVMKITRNQKNKKPYTDTVEILESIIDLQDKLQQDKEDISDLKKERINRTASHELKRPGGPELDDSIRHLQKIRNRERGMIRTERLLNRILKQLDKMKGEEGYEILEMRYLKGMTSEQVAEELHYSKRTIDRKHKKLITKLGRKLLGADAME